MLSKLTGGLGGHGFAGSATRMGIMGSLYSGVLTPTDGNSQHFWQDRLTNGAIGAVTMAGMGLTAAGLDRTGLWAVPAARSLMGSITYGAGSGLGAGFVFAEANARLKEGRWATLAEVWTAEKSFATFGALYGAASYAYHRVTNPAPQLFKTYEGTTRVWSDNSGTPYRVQVRKEYLPGSYCPGFDNVKLTTGAWRTPYYSDHFGRGSGDYPVASVTRTAEGAVKIDRTTHPLKYVHQLNPDGQFKTTRESPTMKGTRTYVRDNLGLRRFDETGRLVSIEPPADLINFEGATFRSSGGRGAELSYDATGQISRVSVFTPTTGGSYLKFQSTGPNSYEVSAWAKGPTVWNGTIKDAPPTTQGGAETINFTPQNGSPFDYGAKSNSLDVVKAIFGSN